MRYAIYALAFALALPSFAAAQNLGGGAGLDNRRAGIAAAPASTITVGQGGTGATTLTDHGVLLGSGTGAVTPMAVCDTGKPIVGVTGSDPVCSGATLPSSGTVPQIITGTATATGAEVVAHTCADDATTITVTGAVEGDACMLGTPAAGPGTNLSASCFVSAADTAVIRFCSNDDANQTPTAGTYRATIIK